MTAKIFHFNQNNMPQVVTKDEPMNAILSTMWIINNKIAKNVTISKEEKEFYNKYLDLIQTYYKQYGNYWAIQSKVK